MPLARQCTNWCQCQCSVQVIKHVTIPEAEAQSARLLTRVAAAIAMLRLLVSGTGVRQHLGDAYVNALLVVVRNVVEAAEKVADSAAAAELAELAAAVETAQRSLAEADVPHGQ
jgi:hypothetical protein